MAEAARGRAAMAGVALVLSAGAAWGQQETPAGETPVQEQAATTGTGSTGSGSTGAGAAAIEEAGKDRWHLNAEPMLWYVAPAGKLRMPASPSLGAGDEIELDELNLDSPRLSPFAEVSLTRGRWGIFIGGFAFSASDRDVVIEDAPVRLGDMTLNVGDSVTSSLDFASAEAFGTYRLYEYRWDRSGGGWELNSRVDGMLGARIYDVEFDIRNGSAREDSDEFFAEPVAGVQWSMDIGEQFSLDVRATAGIGPWGDRSSWSFDIAPAFQWRPIEHVGVEVGYRLLVHDLSSGDGAEEFEWRGSMAGVFFGVVVQF